MGRVARTLQKPIVIFAVVGLAIVGFGTQLGYNHYHQAATVTTENTKTTYVRYDGVAGQNALDLLKKYTTVQTKHYSFGDQVTSINGTEGNGPKYWSFYLNGKLADVGAGSYTTKDGDKIEWKLQQL